MYPFSFRSTLLPGAALAAILSAPAHAQDETSAGPGATPAKAEEPASNDIIVTARRRSESAQDIPLAVSVVDAKQLDATGAFNVNRLQQLAPTLQFYSSNPRNTAVNIRGLGVPFGLTSDGFEQGVGIYVDDVYYSRVASATFDFLDVAQIEVLRGPQGTLYGKNTTAGA
ncbi:MAG: TonB-dependent receptor plug domain-containing protein, partial [Erythrobacter sp.]